MKIFGFNNFKKGDSNIIEDHYIAQNILNVLGWFPFLGTIIGSIRIGATIVICVVDEESSKTNHKKYYALSIVRGVVEVFSLGFVFIIPDIIASIVRTRERKMKARENSLELEAVPL